MMIPASLALPPGAPPTGRRPWGVVLWCACDGAGMPASPSGGGRLPAEYGRPAPSMAARLPLAPALPRPPGTVRHVPDLFGSVLSASAVAAGVLADSRGSAWGWLSQRPPGRTAVLAVLLAGPIPASWRRHASAIDPRLRRRRGFPSAAGATCLSGTAWSAVLAVGPPDVETAGLLTAMIAAIPAAVVAARRVGLVGAGHGGGVAPGGGAMLGGAIGVVGAMVLIDRPFLKVPGSGRASVLVAVLLAAVLLAATALVRVAGASGRETEPRSQRAAEEGPAMPRRLLAEPRGRSTAQERWPEAMGGQPATNRSDHAHR
ncbi:hypothetical protein [Nonomuraea sp. NPDC049400]|uniref:hypothetical protein n=1 Tax=Nonomuraea sp. NPDC049400 TaxID=3364352 RepID=UPI0037B87E3C